MNKTTTSRAIVVFVLYIAIYAHKGHAISTIPSTKLLSSNTTAQGAFENDDLTRRGLIETPKRRNCPVGCSERGNCNYDSGECECPWGWTGPRCEVDLIPACKMSPADPGSCGKMVPKNCLCYAQCFRLFCTSFLRREHALYEQVMRRWDETNGAAAGDSRLTAAENPDELPPALDLFFRQRTSTLAASSVLELPYAFSPRIHKVHTCSRIDVSTYMAVENFTCFIYPQHTAAHQHSRAPWDDPELPKDAATATADDDGSMDLSSFPQRYPADSLPGGGGDHQQSLAVWFNAREWLFSDDPAKFRKPAILQNQSLTEIWLNPRRRKAGGGGQQQVASLKSLDLEEAAAFFKSVDEDSLTSVRDRSFSRPSQGAENQNPRDSETSVDTASPFPAHVASVTQITDPRGTFRLYPDFLDFSLASSGRCNQSCSLLGSCIRKLVRQPSPSPPGEGSGGGGSVTPSPATSKDSKSNKNDDGGDYGDGDAEQPVSAGDDVASALLRKPEDAAARAQREHKEWLELEPTPDDPSLRIKYECLCRRGRTGAGCELPEKITAGSWKLAANSSCWFFPNCNGRGLCKSGFCHCRNGFWGLGCQRSVPAARDTVPWTSPAATAAALPGSGADLEGTLNRGANDDSHPSSSSTSSSSAAATLAFSPHWLRGDADMAFFGQRGRGHFAVPFARTKMGTLPPGSPPQNLRHLRIYVYDLPWHIAYTDEIGEVMTVDPIYQADSIFLNFLLRDDKVLTHDPETANLFFVPLMEMFKTSNTGTQTAHVEGAVAFVKQRYPFWNRSGGRDHVLFLTRDMGACGLPRWIMEPTIKLVHFGYFGDDYAVRTWWPKAAAGRRRLRISTGTDDDDDDDDDDNDDGTLAVTGVTNAATDVATGGARGDETWNASRVAPRPWPDNCFRRGRDVVVPPTVSHHMPPSNEIEHFCKAMIQMDGKDPSRLGGPLLFFAGESRRDMGYSGGARQALFDLARRLRLNTSASSVLAPDPPGLRSPEERGGGGGSASGALRAPSPPRLLPRLPELVALHGASTVYGDLLRRSSFCFAPYGHGWGGRIGEAIAHGCIPVIVQDNVSQPLDEYLVYRRFSVTFQTKDLASGAALDELRALAENDGRMEQLRRGMCKAVPFFVWERTRRGGVYRILVRTLAARVSALYPNVVEAQLSDQTSGKGNGKNDDDDVADGGGRDEQ